MSFVLKKPKFSLVPKGTTELYCLHIGLESLEGCPSSVKVLNCSNNKLTSLKGCPPSVKKLYCSSNQLTSLEGCPPSVQVFDCSSNQLTSLEGCPPSVKNLYCYTNQLTSLEGCPSSVHYLNYDNNPLDPNGINTLEKVKEHNFKKGIEKVKNVLFLWALTTIQRRFWERMHRPGGKLMLREMERCVSMMT